ncbi:MAG: MarR family winged helix-turn-helix transcriptional regulator [Rhizobiaceae bacterium]|nr:MarR family winged helix-turn-helix transcriptional regulator [Rhizobiaceae bacterium]
MAIPDSTTINAWTRLLRAHNHALATVEAKLKNSGMPQLAWYDVMLELERSGVSGIRPYELQAKLLLAQYGLSRLLNRMEKAGYLRRDLCIDDGRGQLLFITGKGKTMRKRMWEIYGPAIKEAVGDNLSQLEMIKLSEILGKLIKEKNAN